MIAMESGRREVLEKILREDRHDKPDAFLYMMDKMFRGIPVESKTAIDIGSGRGLASIWLALQGAERVVSMEPELEGSRSGTVELQRTRVAELGLNNVEVITDDFHEFETDETFDVVVSNASINHLKESPYNARKHEKTFNDFVQIAEKFKALLRAGGVAVVTDAARHGFFSAARAIGVPKRFCYYSKSIDYRIHQDAKVWELIFLEAGFSRVEISYPVPFALRKAESGLDNALANYFLKSAFILHAWS